jgi:hypothetical protein
MRIGSVRGLFLGKCEIGRTGSGVEVGNGGMDVILAGTFGFPQEVIGPA